MFYGQFLGRDLDVGIFTAPSRQVCLKCYTTTRMVSASGDLLIPHRAHVVILNLNCTTCHGKLVHWPNPKGLNRPPMVGCLTRCHDGRKAPNSCSKCHTEKAAPDSHKAPDWLPTHGQKTGLIKCGTCHGWAPDLCKACHSNKPASTHVGNWKKLHQVRARERGKGCLVCHGGKKFCLNCHDQGLFDKPMFKEGR